MKKIDTAKKMQEKSKGFTKKIGNTAYDVSFHYSRQNRESMNDKIIRLRQLLPSEVMPCATSLGIA